MQPGNRYRSYTKLFDVIIVFHSATESQPLITSGIVRPSSHLAINMEKPQGGRVDLGSRNKSEVITIRINPKLKFGLELMARLHNRSVAQTVEMAIQRVLEDPFDGIQNSRDVRYDSDIIKRLWSPHRGERLLKMVLTHPELLSFEEEVLWNKLTRAGVTEHYLEGTGLDNLHLRPGCNLREFEARIADFWDKLDEAERATTSKAKGKSLKEPTT